MRAGNTAGIYWDILSQEEILGEVQPTSTSVIEGCEDGTVGNSRFLRVSQ